MSKEIVFTLPEPATVMVGGRVTLAGLDAGEVTKVDLSKNLVTVEVADEVAEMLAATPGGAPVTMSVSMPEPEPYKVVE